MYNFVDDVADIMFAFVLPAIFFAIIAPIVVFIAMYIMEFYLRYIEFVLKIFSL